MKSSSSLVTLSIYDILLIVIMSACLSWIFECGNMYTLSIESNTRHFLERWFDEIYLKDGEGIFGTALKCIYIAQKIKRKRNFPILWKILKNIKVSFFDDVSFKACKDLENISRHWCCVFVYHSFTMLLARLPIQRRLTTRRSLAWYFCLNYLCVMFSTRKRNISSSKILSRNSLKHLYRLLEKFIISFCLPRSACLFHVLPYRFSISWNKIHKNPPSIFSFHEDVCSQIIFPAQNFDV